MNQKFKLFNSSHCQNKNNSKTETKAAKCRFAEMGDIKPRDSCKLKLVQEELALYKSKNKILEQKICFQAREGKEKDKEIRHLSDKNNMLICQLDALRKIIKQQERTNTELKTDIKESKKVWEKLFEAIEEIRYKLLRSKSASKQTEEENKELRQVICKLQQQKQTEQTTSRVNKQSTGRNPETTLNLWESHLCKEVEKLENSRLKEREGFESYGPTFAMDDEVKQLTHLERKRSWTSFLKQSETSESTGQLLCSAERMIKSSSKKCNPLSDARDKPRLNRQSRNQY